MLKTFATGTALALVLGTAAFADYQTGMEAYGKANYGIAFNEFQESARDGDAASQHMLGELYAEGRGVRQDLVQAHMWYSLAAAWGHDRADAARRNLERYMSSGQLAEARELADRWHAPATTDTGLQFSVRNAQTVLNRLGYNAGPEDGIMGPSTRAAIRTYQSDHGLHADGRLTSALFAQMQEDLRGGQNETVSATLVANVQSELRQRGYDIASISGTVDDATERAIRAYQQQSGLRVDGQPSESLLARLRSSQGTGDIESRRYLVRTVQAELNDLGYNAGPEDGVYGPTTRSAVRAYQADNGLPITGEVSQSLLVDLQGEGSGSAAERERRELALAVEEELAARGYAVGQVDGVVDGQTRAAVRTYQSDAGLRIDGQVSSALLDELRDDQGDRATERQLIAGIQSELNRLGYNAGPADGAFGPKTRRAIVTYQSDMNMQITGEASPRLLERLKDTERRVTEDDDDEVPAMSQAELIRSIEAELNRLDWDVGTPNDEWSNRSRDAAKAFQREIGVTQDGIPDRELLTQLQNSYRRADNPQQLIFGLAQQFIDAIQNDGN